VSFPDIEKSSYAYTYSVGQPLDMAKAYRYAGVDPTNGQYMIYDKDGTPTSSPIEPTQSLFITTAAKYYGGFQNSFSYRGIQLDILFQFVRQKGRKQLYYYNENILPGRFSSSVGNQPVTVLNRWQKPGDNATIARYTTGSLALWPLETDDGITHGASYIRLKNISLSWQWPAIWLQKTSLQNGRLYFRGQNLATITNFTGLDPETQSITTLPPLQMWTAGLQVEF
jgi:hypothetical protein